MKAAETCKLRTEFRVWGGHIGDYIGLRDNGWGRPIGDYTRCWGRLIKGYTTNLVQGSCAAPNPESWKKGKLQEI